MNDSEAVFSKGSDKRSIRVGFLRVDGIGDGAANELVRNQRFNSIDDLKERTNSTRVKKTTIEALRRLGALESIGIEGEADDYTQLQLLDMVVTRPKAFDGIKPHVKRRERGSWEFLGLEPGLNLTFGKRFCAKLFWIPNGTSLELKAAASGRYSAYLLPVVDENGIVFDLKVSESKVYEAELIKMLADCQESVVCVEGQLQLPFLRGGNTTFSVWGVSGANDDNPMIWGVDDVMANKIMRNARAKQDDQRRAT